MMTPDPDQNRASFYRGCALFWLVVVVLIGWALYHTWSIGAGLLQAWGRAW